MSRILIIGAGRSSSSLIDYLLSNAKANAWHITIADSNKAAVESKISQYKEVASAVEFDVNNAQLREDISEKATTFLASLQTNPTTANGRTWIEQNESSLRMLTHAFVVDASGEVVDSVSLDDSMLFPSHNTRSSIFAALFYLYRNSTIDYCLTS